MFSKNRYGQYWDPGKTIVIIGVAVVIITLGKLLLYYHIGFILSYAVGTGIILGSLYGVWNESRNDALTPIVVTVIGATLYYLSTHRMVTFIRPWEAEVIFALGVLTVLRSAFGKKEIPAPAPAAND